MSPARRLATVIVSLKTGVDIMGVLREQTEDAMILSNAAVLGQVNGKDVWGALPGEVVILTDNVDYYQRALPPAILAAIGVPT